MSHDNKEVRDEARTILSDFDALRSFRFIQKYRDRPADDNALRDGDSRLGTAAAAAEAAAAAAEETAADVSVDRAYTLQRAFKALREERGEKTIGFKVGCTSDEIRRALGITESVHGYLWKSEQLSSGAELQHSRYRRLGIEGELGIHLLTTEGPVGSWLVEYEPIIELHHFCFDGAPEHRAFELIARNAIHCGVVHAAGTRKHRGSLSQVPLDIPIVVAIDGRVVEAPILSKLKLAADTAAAAGAAATGGLLGPVATVTWLQQRLQREGNNERLKPGDFVLTATPGNVIPLEAGSRLEVEFMGLYARCTVH